MVVPRTRDAIRCKRIGVDVPRADMLRSPSPMSKSDASVVGRPVHRGRDAINPRMRCTGFGSAGAAPWTQRTNHCLHLDGAAPASAIRGAAALLTLALSACCGPSNFLLQEPLPLPPVVGSYACGPAPAGCRPDQATDETRFNQSGTTQVALPADCKTGIRRILIQNAHSSDATVIVECAAPTSDSPIQTTELPPTTPKP